MKYRCNYARLPNLAMLSMAVLSSGLRRASAMAGFTCDPPRGPRHFFIRRRVFISRAESGGRGEGGDIAISRASIRTIRIRGRTSEIYIVWTRIWTIIFAVPVLDIRCYLWQSFWEKSTSSKYCSIVSEISEFLDEEFPKEDGIGRNDELFWINFVNEGF